MKTFWFGKCWCWTIWYRRNVVYVNIHSSFQCLCLNRPQSFQFFFYNEVDFESPGCNLYFLTRPDSDIRELTIWLRRWLRLRRSLSSQCRTVVRSIWLTIWSTQANYYVRIGVKIFLTFTIHKTKMANPDVGQPHCFHFSTDNINSFKTKEERNRHEM